MTPAASVLDCIGNTPLIRLRRVSEQTGCDIFGKAEFLNPGGSVKDRAALGMLLAANNDKPLRPGTTIVEGTAGNTGIGLALVGRAMGLKTLIVMPDTQSPEKVATLASYGASVKQIPAVPFRNPAHFVHESRRIAEAMNDANPGSAFWPNQFDNTANRSYHATTTGAEIIADTGGDVDAFICAAGTGGTLGGVAQALRRHKADVTIGLADPGGSGLHAYFKTGTVEVCGNSITEGIGNSRITANLAETSIDVSYRIDDQAAIDMTYALIRDEGLVLGGSSGLNVAAAVRLATELGPGHTIVTILCDSGQRYAERLFNPAFLRSKGIEPPLLN